MCSGSFLSHLFQALLFGCMLGCGCGERCLAVVLKKLQSARVVLLVKREKER